MENSGKSGNISIVRTRFKEKKENPSKKLLISAGSLFNDKTIPEPLIFSGLSFFVAIAVAIMWQIPLPK